MTIKDDHFSLERNVVVINAFFHYFYGYIDFGFPFIPLSYMGYFFMQEIVWFFCIVRTFLSRSFPLYLHIIIVKQTLKNRLP